MGKRAFCPGPSQPMAHDATSARLYGLGSIGKARLFAKVFGRPCIVILGIMTATARVSGVCLVLLVDS